MKMFLNNEEEKTVRKFIKKLTKNKKLDYIESGGLGVKVERREEFLLFDIYRIIGESFHEVK